MAIFITRLKTIALSSPLDSLLHGFTNVDTAKQDGTRSNKNLWQIDPKNAQQMLQVRRFFDISVGQGLFMDLTPENFALENGQVVLIDFVEDPDDEIELFHKKAIETWLKSYQQAGGEQAQAAAFLNGLSANQYQDYVQQLLSKYTVKL